LSEASHGWRSSDIAERRRTLGTKRRDAFGKVLCHRRQPAREPSIGASMSSPSAKLIIADDLDGDGTAPGDIGSQALGTRQSLTGFGNLIDKAERKRGLALEQLAGQCHAANTMRRTPDQTLRPRQPGAMRGRSRASPI